MNQDNFNLLKKLLIWMGSVLGTIVLMFIGSVGWYLAMDRSENQTHHKELTKNIDKLYQVTAAEATARAVHVEQYDNLKVKVSDNSETITVVGNKVEELDDRVDRIEIKGRR